MISGEEEVILAQKIREGDFIAVQKLTNANLRFVISVAKQYDRGGHHLTLNDLINEGNIGLIKAAYKFDETRGFKFISYAVWWIRQAIMAAIMNDSRLIRQPTNRVMSYNKVLKTFSVLEQEHQREPTDEEIAEALEMNEDEVTSIRGMSAWPSSIDAPIQKEESFSLLEVLEVGDSPPPDDKLIDSSLKTDINQVLEKLTFRESEILIMFYGLNGRPTSTLIDIGEKLGITRERVRQVKENAIYKLQHDPAGERILRAYL